LAASFAGLALISSQSAQAAASTWSGATLGDWNTGSNWTANSVPTSSDDLTVLGPGNIAGALTINIASATDINANTINFTDTAAVSLLNTSGSNRTLTLQAGLTTGTGGVTIGSATANQNINVALGASQTWSVGSGNLTVNNVISGSGFGITKNGAGTLSLLGANTYSGGLTVNAGIVDIQNNAALGTGTATLAGGTLSASGSADRTITNNIVAQASTTSTLATNGRNITINGNITGGGNINRSAPSSATTVTLAGNNSGYTGTFTQANSGNAVLSFTSANAGSASASWVFQNTTAGRTRIGLGGAGVNATISFGSMTGGGQIQSDFTGTKTISVGALGLNDTFSGIIANGSGTVALTKVGNGTMTLSGNNSYSGGTTISAGKVNATNATSSLGSGAVAVSGGTSATLGGTGTITGAVTVTSSSHLAPGTVTTASNFGSVGTLTLSSASGLTLTAANLDFDLSTSGASGNDKIALGANALTFSTLSFNFSGTTLDTTTPYTLISTTGSLTSGDVTTITSDFTNVTGGSYTASYSFLSGTGLQVTFSAIPESHEFAIAIVGLLCVMVVIRRRNQEI